MRAVPVLCSALLAMLATKGQAFVNEGDDWVAHMPDDHETRVHLLHTTGELPDAEKTEAWKAEQIKAMNSDMQMLQHNLHKYPEWKLSMQCTACAGLARHISDTMQHFVRKKGGKNRPKYHFSEELDDKVCTRKVYENFGLQYDFEDGLKALIGEQADSDVLKSEFVFTLVEDVCVAMLEDSEEAILTYDYINGYSMMGLIQLVCFDKLDYCTEAYELKSPGTNGQLFSLDERTKEEKEKNPKPKKAKKTEL